MLEFLYLLTTFSIGLFAGALLTEGCILVPYWQKMEPSEFFRLHGSMGPSLFRYFAPLTAIAVTLSIISALVSILSGTPKMTYLLTAALCFVALSIFFLYFKKANGKFAAHAMENSELTAELKKWAAWHWLRTMFVMAAFGSSILAII